jgi:hypothetical protein
MAKSLHLGGNKKRKKGAPGKAGNLGMSSPKRFVTRYETRDEGFVPPHYPPDPAFIQGQNEIFLRIFLELDVSL